MGCLPRLVKGDLGGFLGHVDVLEEGTVRAMRLLLDRGAELHELVGHGLARLLQDVDQPAPCQCICPCRKRGCLAGELTLLSVPCRAR